MNKLLITEHDHTITHKMSAPCSDYFRPLSCYSRDTHACWGGDLSSNFATLNEAHDDKLLNSLFNSQHATLSDTGAGALCTCNCDRPSWQQGIAEICNGMSQVEVRQRVVQQVLDLG